MGVIRIRWVGMLAPQPGGVKGLGLGLGVVLQTKDLLHSLESERHQVCFPHPPMSASLRDLGVTWSSKEMPKGHVFSDRH